MTKKVIKFWAGYCGPCKTYAPTFEKIKQEFLQNIEFTEIDVENDPEALAAEYRVRGIPCTVIVNNGTEVARQAGSLSENQLRDLISIN